MSKKLRKSGNFVFQSWDELKAFHKQLDDSLQQYRKDHPIDEDFDFQERFNRPRTPEEIVKADGEFEKTKSFYSWLNDNRDSYIGHSYRPGFDMYVDFFLEQNGRFDLDRLSVDGTYTIITGPEGDPLDLPHIQIQKGEMVLDIIHEFSPWPSFLVRINQVYEPSEVMQQFISQGKIYPIILEHLPEFNREQTILPIDELYDLYGVLCILLGKRKDA